MSYGTDKRAVVTGGAGYVSSHVVDRLREVGCRSIAAPRSRHYDLRDPLAASALLVETRPHTIIHLAAVVGGIGANRELIKKYLDAVAQADFAPGLPRTVEWCRAQRLALVKRTA
jgi:nucleoside-diphosphate-sugar epimerase